MGWIGLVRVQVFLFYLIQPSKNGFCFFFFPIWYSRFINIRAPFAIIGLASANLFLWVFLLCYLRYHTGDIKCKLTYFTDRLRNLCYFFKNIYLFKISTNTSHWNAHPWLLSMKGQVRLEATCSGAQEEASWYGCGPTAAGCTSCDGDQHAPELGGTLTLAQMPDATV